MRLLPAITLLLAALFAVLPFGVTEVLRGAIGMLPLMVAHYWSARRPQLLPVPLIFAVGLAIDILTHKALGYTALLALVVASIAPLESWIGGRSSALGRALVFALAMLAAALVAWATTSIYMGVMAAGHPYLLSALIAICFYPLMALALMGIDRLWETPRAQIFIRGG